MTAGAEPSVLPKGGRPCTGTGAAEEGAQQAYGGILLSPSGIPAAYSSSCSGEIL